MNSVIAKYRDLSVSHRSIICLNLRLRQKIDLLATDKSRYFAQSHPKIVNYLVKHTHRFHWVWNISISKEIIIPSSTIKIIVIIVIIIITTLEAIDKHHPAYKESHTIWLVAQGSDSFKLFKFHGFFHCPFPVFHDLYKFSCHLQKNY